VGVKLLIDFNYFHFLYEVMWLSCSGKWYQKKATKACPLGKITLPVYYLQPPITEVNFFHY